MTDTPPPSDDETSRLPATPPPSGAPYPGPPAEDWQQPPVKQGRFRTVGRRLRGSRVALAVAAVIVAAALVGGGVAVGHEVGGGERDGRGASAETRNGDGDGRGAGRHGGRGAERDAQGEDGRRGGTGFGNGSGNGSGNGTRQQVLGTITAISGSTITVRTSGGNPSYPVTATTPVTRGGSAASVADLKTGDAVVLQIVVVSTGAAPVVASISAG